MEKMAKPTFNAEEHLQAFVHSKTAERVVLDITNPSALTIKSKAKRGSTVLAIFWVNVLQHKNNYPVQRYPYRDLYDKNGSHRVILRVDDVTITVFMSTGTLMIQGEFVLDWFLKCFTKVMEAYDSPSGDSRPVSDGYKFHEKKWREYETKDKPRKDKEMQKLMLEYEKHLIERSGIVSLSTDEKDVKANSREASDRDVEAHARNSAPVPDDTPLQNGTAAQNGGTTEEELSADDLCDDLELLNLEVWPEQILQKQLNDVRTPAVKEGPNYIYKIWKSLLNLWLADPDNRVYIVTPFLDTDRMMDICDLVLKHHLTSNIDAFYVRIECNHGQKISDVKKRAQSQYGPKDQVFIEYKLYNRIVYPLVRVHAKFIACVNKNGQADVLLTSANFHADHFEHSNRDHVVFHTMSEAKFVQRFLKPLNTSVERRM